MYFPLVQSDAGASADLSSSIAIGGDEYESLGSPANEHALGDEADSSERTDEQRHHLR